jgi:CRP-like cAMP-binding protein
MSGLALILMRQRKTEQSTAKEDDFEEVRSILALPRKQRSTQQVQFLANFTLHVKLFSDMQQDPHTHLQCCHCLTYAFCPANKYVFRQGDPGTNFYIILKGCCAVQITGNRSDGRAEQRLLTVLKQGECFGEMALLGSQPRQASILCREDSHFAVLSREDYTRILSKAHERMIRAKVDVLIKLPVFRKLSKGALTRLTYFFKIKRFQRKQAVYSAGDPATEVYIVKEGDFQLTKAVEMAMQPGISPKAPRHRGYSVNVTLLGTGELLGSAETIHSKPHAYTCTCYSTTGELMAISRADFMQFLGSEELLTYLDNLHVAKEEVRGNRIATATQIQRSQHISLVQDTSSARPAPLPMPRTEASNGPSTRHSRTSSALISLIDRSSLASNAASHTKKPVKRGKSWSQVFLQKYSLADKATLGARHKTKRIVNYHTFSLKDLKQSRQRNCQKGGGYSWSSIALNESSIRFRLTDVSQM